MLIVIFPVKKQMTPEHKILTKNVKNKLVQ